MKKAVIVIAVLLVFFATAASSAGHSRTMLLGEGLVDGFEKSIEFPNRQLYHGKKGGVQMKWRKVLMVKLQDYEETGPNSKHDPTPKKKPSGNGNA